jgi:hypothetical protein
MEVYNIECLTLVDGLGHGDSYPHTDCSLWAVVCCQVLTVRQLQSLQDDGVGTGDDVLGLTQVILQDLAFVLADRERRGRGFETDTKIAVEATQRPDTC